MKGIILYFIGFYFAYASPAERTPGRYEIKDLKQDAIFEPLQESDIQLYFHIRQGSADGIKVNVTDRIEIASLGFFYEKDTMFIIHGLHDRYDSPVIQAVAKAAMDQQDINVFVVDWSKISNKDYEEVFPVVPEVGKLLGKLMESLANDHGLKIDRTTVAGHSLGAHVAGAACAYLGSECNVIVGLDPAGPHFSYDNKENRLDTSDAQFVHVIHTNAGLLGFPQAIGHADYFPNGGSVQPGCESDTTGWCSHDRAFLYYAESLTSYDFLALKCDNFNDYENGRCADQPESIMGYYFIDTGASGSYFLKTHSSPPYAMGGDN